MSAATNSNARNDDIPAPIVAPSLPTQRSSLHDTAVPNNVIPLREADRAYVPSQSYEPAVEQAPAAAERTSRWSAEWPLIIVMSALALSLGVAVAGSFRLGMTAFIVAIALGFCLRLVLPDGRAGMLKVRSKAVDLIILGAIAAIMIFTAVSLPPIG